VCATAAESPGAQRILTRGANHAEREELAHIHAHAHTQAPVGLYTRDNIVGLHLPYSPDSRVLPEANSLHMNSSNSDQLEVHKTANSKHRVKRAVLSDTQLRQD